MPVYPGAQRNQYGGTFGGPVIKNKTFFFASYQGTNTRQLPNSLVSFVPTAAQRAGDLSGLAAAKDPLNNGQPFPGNQLPKDRLDPTMQKFLQRLIPLPNGPNGMLTYGQASPRDVHEVIARGDHYFGSKDKVFGSYFDQRDRGPNSGDPTNVLSLNFGADFVTRKVTVGENHIFSPAMTNEFRFTFARTQTLSKSAAPVANDFTWQDIGMKIPRLTQKPEMLYFASPFFGFYAGEQLDLQRRSLQFANTLSWVRSRHEIKFGGEYVRNYMLDGEDWEVDGRPVFSQNRTGSPYADLMLGLPATFEQLNPSFVQADRNRFMFFAQDTYRMNRKLTLTYGLRYEPYLNWHTRQGEFASFISGQQSKIYPNLPPGLLVAGDAGVPGNGFNNLWNRFGPRLGLAYDPFGDGKTSIRGGWGVFHEALSTVALSNYDTSQPFTTAVLFNEPNSFTDPYRGQVNPFPAPIPAPKDQPLPRPLGVVYSFPVNFQLPRVQQWNLAVERQIPGQFVARVAYVGSRGADLHRNRDINAARFIPGNDAQGNPLSTTGNANSRRSYQGFQNIYQSEGTGRSSLHSMLLTVERRMAHGFAIKANYTFQKSLDDAPQTAGAQHQNVLRNPLGNPDVFGPSDFDRKHRFVTNFVWQLPTPFSGVVASKWLLGGWQLTGIATLQSGPPFTVSSAGSPSRDSGRTPHYADVVAGCNVSARGSGVEPRLQWFNTACFQNAAVGTFGNLGRNTLRGPGFKAFDMGLYRNFPIRERMNAQFRAEFFNILNHPNFGLPNASLGNPAAFGTITATSGGLYGEGAASDPRIIQFALKLVF